MMEGISLEKKEGYAILSVDIPQTRNALSVPIVEYMDTLVDSVIADKDIHCLVITGGGEKSFVAGADIAKLVKMSPAEARYPLRLGISCFPRLKPWIFRLWPQSTDIAWEAAWKSPCAVISGSVPLMPGSACLKSISV